MTPEQLRMVQTSYARLGDDATSMALEFYRRLFEADPTARDLFSVGPDAMAPKFAAELQAIVELVSSFDDLSPRVRDLAVRHVAYGVEPRHYHAVGDALIGALAEHLGEDWDPVVEAAWRRAYNLVAEMMMAVAAEVDLRAPAARPPVPDVTSTTERGRDAT